MENITTFNDIFKSSFIDKATSFSFTDVFIALSMALIIGLFIYLVYKKTFQGVMYSRSFNVSLVMLAILTTFVILAVTSNVILSLGMVGALSIVRFRTAIKDPMDLVFLFWAIGAGIVCGAGLIPLALVGSTVIGIVLVLFVQHKIVEAPYIVVVNCDSDEAEKLCAENITLVFPRCKIKSKTVTGNNNIEIVYEIRLKNNETSFVDDLNNIDGVNNVALVSFNGDYVL
jgi:uncharacterized membrane protein YhiD involved in acid resistance